jgi:type II secretory pathway pseudopilin PulG
MSRFLGNPLVRAWLAIIGVATLVLGAAYAMAQQSTRLSADDLPLTTAQVAKQELQHGSDAKDVVPTLKTDLKTDTSVFMIITDNTAHVLASSATLDGQTPLPPSGVFAFTNIHGTDHFTWEPSAGVRIATRVVSYGHGTNSGYIITGQSLQPFEDRISTYNWIALAALLASIAWSYLLILLPHAHTRPARSKKA